MAKMRLNDRTVRGLRTQEGRSYSEFWDTILPGFGLRVFPSGRQTWFVRYRSEEKQVRRSLGQYPAMGVAEARESAREEMGSSETKAPAQAGSTNVEQLVDLYQELHAPRKRPSSRVEDERMLKKDILPALGTLALEDIGVAEVAAVVDGVARRGSPIMANRTRALLSKLWAFGMARGLVESNPVAATERPGVERPRDRVLSDDEIRALWAAWDEDSSLMGSLYQVLLLTAQRSGEVKAMAWNEIEGNTWTIPGERAKNGRLHAVPLSPLAQEHLRLSYGRDSRFVFPGTGKAGHVTTLARATQRFRKASGVSDWSPHDLRRTATSRLAELGVAPHVLGALLNHTPTGVTHRVYNRYQYREEVREALTLWGEHVRSLIGGADLAGIVPDSSALEGTSAA